MSTVQSRGPRIAAVQPTIFFVSSGRGLRRGVDVEVTDPAGKQDLSLRLLMKGEPEDFSLKDALNGDGCGRIYVEDIREETDLEFQLLSDSSVVDSTTIHWKPGRHWTVHLCQIAHFDPGYTDLPSNVMREYLDFLDHVVEWCEKTARWPAGAQFSYTVEQAWVALHYVENRPQKAIERFARLCRAGQIEVNAFYANMTSELMGPEEVARLMYPAFRLKRLYGIPVRTAEHNDVPGISWSYATIMADVGIELFAPGVPDYFHWGETHRRNFADHLIRPGDLPSTFYWQAPNGKRVLVYLPADFRLDCDSNLSALPSVLEGLDSSGYPYNTVRHTLNGGQRDNSPPLFDFAETVRDWNEKWAYPRYLLSTNHRFYLDLSAELGDEVPVFRGDYPGTDYPLGATSTAEEVGANRHGKGFLFVGERFAGIASEVSDYAYPREPLDRAYRLALQHDEHAWGLSTPSGWAAEAHKREKALYAYQAAALGEDVLLKSINMIADQIALAEEGRYVVVFNPADRPRTEVVEVPFAAERPCGMPMHRVDFGPEDPRAPILRNGTAVGREMQSLPVELIDGSFHMVDIQSGVGCDIQKQQIESHMNPVRFSPELHTMSTYAPEYRASMSFLAKDVPAFGYRSYRVSPGQRTAESSGEIEVARSFMENRYYRVSFDPVSGALVGVYDKELQRELVDADAPHAFAEVFCRRSATGEIERATVTRSSLAAAGPVTASMLIESTLPGAPRIVTEVLLHAGVRRVDVRVRMLAEGDGTLAIFVAFPFKVTRPRFTFDGPAHTMSPVVDQLPGTTTDYYSVRSRVAIRETDGALAVIWSAREAPMVQFGRNWPDYVSQAHHGALPHHFDHEFLSDPDGFSSGHLYSYLTSNNYRTNFSASQAGMILSTYSFTSGADVATASESVIGLEFCTPMPHAVLSGARNGELPVTHSFCDIDTGGVMITTIKRAEDGENLIVRLLETEGIDKEVTVAVPFFPFVRAVRTNLVEEGADPLPCEDRRFRVHVDAWSYATVRLVRPQRTSPPG